MAFTFAINQAAANNAFGQDGSVIVAVWSAGAGGDAGDPIEFVQFADVCMQATGTIGTSTLTLQGSNDGTNWETLNSAQGAALSFTALTSTIKQVVERPRYIRPNLSAGTATGIAVTLVMRRAQPIRS